MLEYKRYSLVLITAEGGYYKEDESYFKKDMIELKRESKHLLEKRGDKLLIMESWTDTEPCPTIYDPSEIKLVQSREKTTNEVSIFL